MENNLNVKEDITSIDWGLEPLHEKMLEMLIDLDDFCERYGIEYSLAYGTALGAVRHGGFIPWDDDVDIYMDSFNYNIFEKAFYKYGNMNKYYIQKIGKWRESSYMSKIRMNGTTYIEPTVKELDIHHGIYIDIFVLHDCPNNTIEIEKKKIANYYYLIKRLSNLHYSKRKMWLPVLAMLRLFPSNFGQEKALSVIAQHDGLNTDYFFDGEYKSNSQVYPKKLIFPAKKMVFCGVKLKAPRHVEKYLSVMYGDYMKIPSKKQIEWSTHVGEWYTDVDYREIVKRDVSFKDEEL